MDEYMSAVLPSPRMVRFDGQCGTSLNGSGYSEEILLTIRCVFQGAFDMEAATRTIGPADCGAIENVTQGFDTLGIDFGQLADVIQT